MVREVTGRVEGMLEALAMAMELMSQETDWAPDVFELGVACGKLHAARALTESARITIEHVINQQAHLAAHAPPKSTTGN